MKYITLTMLLLLCSSMLFAQSIAERQITGSYAQQGLEAILDDLQRQSRIPIFYKPSQLPVRLFSADFEDTPLPDVLAELLRPTTLDFLTFRDQLIVLMPERVLQEVYSADYYQALEASIELEEQEQVETVTRVGAVSELAASGKALVSGRILEEVSGEPVIGATVFWPDLELGLVTDEKGQFEASVPTGRQLINVQFVGYRDLQEEILVLSDGELTLRLAQSAVALSEVVVEAESPDANVQRAQISVEEVDMKAIKKLPTFLGEVDVVKSLLSLPGVSTIAEGAVGFNVRGGEVDQNLIQQDEGIIFNSSHALGFFSTFNPDLINSVELYKANIPAQFGGRLASVLDVKMSEGDFETFKLKGGVGPVTSRISLETPVVKGKSSLVGGFRSSYINWVLGLVNVPEIERSRAFFYDANLGFTQRIGQGNTITASGYISQDDFSYNEEVGFDYATMMGQVSYRKVFNDKLFNKLSLIISSYESNQQDLEGLDAGELQSQLDYWKVKDQVTWLPVEPLQLDMGLESIRYSSRPGDQRPLDVENTTIGEAQLEEENAGESAVFANAEYQLSPAILIAAGIRFNYYQFLGSQTVFQYQNSDRPELAQTTGTETFEKGETIASYTSLEPRVSLRYRLNAESSVKAGYSRTAQFINQIFNADNPLPTSQWQLSTTYIEPLRSHNYSIGYFRNFDNNLWETSAELFYREIDALYDYKDFADLTVNDQLETELLDGTGRAYGVELSLEKKEGQFNGRMSYTYSRTERQVAGINDGNFYPSNFDKPHNLSLILNYQFNQRNTLTVNFALSSGRPVTFPLGNFESTTGLVIPFYSDRNQLRIPTYHRMDLAYTLGEGYNKTKRIKTSWTISLYNVYGRQNAYSVFFTQAPFQGTQANRLSVLGSVFPSVTINFEFL